ncbi:MAG: hypothetical protein HQL09_06050 [Nitrospirae bacterium]|nr:hypothetical protein [Nitrospirota bacterium]
MDMTPFNNLIKERCGLCFNGVRAPILEDSIRKRMSQTGAESCAKYFNRIVDSRDEFCQLVNLLTVNETYFFREPSHLDLLVTRILPELLAVKKPEGRINIVSAGCSTGEEPYSIVIRLMEKYGSGVQNLVSVTGFDIDSYALAVARKGVYGVHSFRGFPDDLREKYFERTGESNYKVRDVVRNRVEFVELNLLSEAYPDKLRGADIIFYRNVSIYFEPETQKNIFRNLAGMLNENGYLLVGSAETLSHDIGVLSLVEMDGLFLYRKKIEIEIVERRKAPLRGGTRSNTDFFSSQLRRVPSSPLPASGLSGERRKDSHQLFDEALGYAKTKRYDDALRCLDDLMDQDQAFIGAYTLKSGVLINLKRLDEAEHVCGQSIEMDQWCLEGYLLLGLIARIKSDDETALKRFKEALYIQSSCWLAHFYLAEIYRSRDEAAAACREYEIVVKLLRKGDIKDHGLVFFPLAFPADQITHLCNHNLAQLQKRVAGTGRG